MKPDHELKIGSTTKQLELIRQDGAAMYSVTELISGGEYQEELRFTQADWKGGHGSYDFNYPDMYFEGQSIDTTQPNRLFLGPLIIEENENDDTDLDSAPQYFLWYSKIKKLICSTAGNVYRLAPATLQEFYNIGENYDYSVYDTTWAAQTFTPLDAHTVVTIKLKMYRVGSPGTITASVRATTADVPSGADLCDGTYNGDTLTTNTDGEWVSFDQGAGTALTADTMYSIVLNASNGNSSNKIVIKTDGESPTYTGGTAATSTDSGATWTKYTNYDVLFEEHDASTTQGWTPAATTLAGVTDLVEYDGVAYAAMGSDNLYYTSTNGSNWTVTDLADGYAEKFFVAPNPAGTRDYLYKTKFPNELSWTTNGQAGGTEWSSPAYIGDTSTNTSRVFLVGDKLQIGKVNGLFFYDTDGGVHPIMDDLKTSRTTKNFQYVTAWQSYVYFSLGTGVGELSPAYDPVFDSISPLTEIDDIGKVGHCVGLTSDENFLYVAMNEGTNTVIYKGRQITREQGLRWEWCPWVFLGTNYCANIIVVQHSEDDKRLWFGYGNSTGYVIITDDPTADSNARFAPSGFLRMSYIYGTDPYWDKNFQSVITETEACTANLTVTPKYRKNTDTSATNLTSAITTNGHVKTDCTAEVTAKKIQFELHLATNDSTTTPEVKYFQARGTEYPEYLRVHECTYSCAGTPYWKPSEIRSFLRGGRTSTSLIKFSDLRYNPAGTAGTENTDYVWVKMLGSPEEIEIYNEKLSQPEIALRCRFREVSF